AVSGRALVGGARLAFVTRGARALLTRLSAASARPLGERLLALLTRLRAVRDQPLVGGWVVQAQRLAVRRREVDEDEEDGVHREREADPAGVLQLQLGLGPDRARRVGRLHEEGEPPVLDPRARALGQRVEARAGELAVGAELALGLELGEGAGRIADGDGAARALGDHAAQLAASLD